MSAKSHILLTAVGSYIFFSYLPNLVKNVRNRLLVTTFDTPDGAVLMQFAREALKLDSNVLTMETVPGIMSVHISPHNFEKNVGKLCIPVLWAWSFVSIFFFTILGWKGAVVKLKLHRGSS